jgi:hypothetical protein
VKCNFCGDYFTLYPQKKNLDMNLRIQVASVSEILECHNVKGHYDELLVYIFATK